MSIISEIQKLLSVAYPEIPMAVKPEGKGFVIEIPESVPEKDETCVDVENIRYVVEAWMKCAGKPVSLGETRRV